MLLLTLCSLVAGFLPFFQLCVGRQHKVRMMDNSFKEPSARAPRTRTCYICGRSYGVHSYDIHIKQCKELWIARESVKPIKERKPLPEDPFLKLQSEPNSESYSEEELQKINAIAAQSYNNESLVGCSYCGRTFLPEKLLIHNRSCTAENPAKRVNATIKANTESNGTTSIEPPKVKKANPKAQSLPPVDSPIQSNLQVMKEDDISKRLSQLENVVTGLISTISQLKTEIEQLKRAK